MGKNVVSLGGDAAEVEGGLKRMNNQRVAFGGVGAELLELILAWQGGKVSRDAVVRALVGLPDTEGGVLRALIGELVYRFGDAQPSGSPQAAVTEGTDAWREELLACRARAWAQPEPAGLLIGPEVMILLDGDQGVILRAAGVRVLPRSLAGSVFLLCQTIVMAQHAVDVRELSALQHQRIESTSTSLSEIEPIK